MVDSTRKYTKYNRYFFDGSCMYIYLFFTMTSCKYSCIVYTRAISAETILGIITFCEYNRAIIRKTYMYFRNAGKPKKVEGTCKVYINIIVWVYQ